MEAGIKGTERRKNKKKKQRPKVYSGGEEESKSHQWERFIVTKIRTEWGPDCLPLSPQKQKGCKKASK